MKSFRAIAFALAGLTLSVGATQMLCCGSSGTKQDVFDASVENARRDSTPDRTDEKTFDSSDAAEATISDGGCKKPNAAGVPSGWIPYDKWSCACELYVPGEHGELPKPFEWGPCLPAAPKNINCRMLITEEFENTGNGSAFVSIDPKTGKLVMSSMMEFKKNNHQLFVIGEVDGRMRNAVMMAYPYLQSACGMNAHAMQDGKFALRLVGDSPRGSRWAAEGHAGGDIDDRNPPMIFPEWRKDKSQRIVEVTSRWVVEMTGGGVWLHDWATPNVNQKQIYPLDGFWGLQIFGFSSYKDDLFLESSGAGNEYVTSYTPKHGTRPVLNWLDESRSAGGFETDGKDMVWVYGQGKPTGGGYHEYTKYQIVTAPHSTDPAEVEKTKRVIDEYYVGSLPDPSSFAVGCGYAAQYVHIPIEQQGLTVYRLSDGAKWLIPNSQPNNKEWQWSTVKHVSCEEIFLSAYFDRDLGFSSIARVRLDSLGPPTRPGVAR